ncbi:MAG: hypothetical protein SGPRY_000629 [Prymnesium sp.]
MGARLRLYLSDWCRLGVEYVTTSFATEQKKLKRENAELHHLETQVSLQMAENLRSTRKELQTSVSSEHAALLECGRQAARVEEMKASSQEQLLVATQRIKSLRDENVSLERDVQQRDKKLWTPVLNLINRPRGLKDEMASRKRLEESRTQTSGLLLERAQLTESTVVELQDDMDELHEILKEKDKAADAENEKMHGMLVTNYFAAPLL